MAQSARPVRKVRRGSTWDDAAIDVSGIAKRLAATREATGLNKSSFARMAGIWPNLYGQFESGKRVLTIGAAVKIANTHNVSLDWLYLGRTDGLSQAITRKIAALLPNHPAP